MTVQSPQKPWKKGRHPEYVSFSLVVNICQDEHGNVWSDHTFASSADEAIAGTMQQGAIPQIAHALLTEAVRREAFQTILVVLSHDPDLLTRWKQAKPEDRTKLQRGLEETVAKVVSLTTHKMASGSVTGVLDMLAEQHG